MSLEHKSSPLFLYIISLVVVDAHIYGLSFPSINYIGIQTQDRQEHFFIENTIFRTDPKVSLEATLTLNNHGGHGADNRKKSISAKKLSAFGYLWLLENLFKNLKCLKKIVTSLLVSRISRL